MASTPMFRIFSIGKNMSMPKFGLYWARRGVFTKPGLVAWVFRRHVRLLPLPGKRGSR